MGKMTVGDAGVAKPFVKWVGGKGQLLTQFDALLPKDLSTCKRWTYVEPFVGGGAMLFHMLQRFPNIRRAVINDINHDLISTYRVVKSQSSELITGLAKLQDQYHHCRGEEEREEMFLSKRERYNSGYCHMLETATLFIFLNRTCFNGLYRVNSKGKYNVSFGKYKNPLICDATTIQLDSELLQKVDIRHGDFADVFDGIKNPVFAYLDPPYRPLTYTAGFTGYSKEGFSDVEQCRLGRLCRELDRRGCRWLASNSDPHNVNQMDDFFDDLYSGFDIRRVSANRMVNSKGSGRGKIAELAIRNYCD